LSTRKNAIFRTFSPGVPAGALAGRFSQIHPGIRLQGRAVGAGRATLSLIFLRFVLGSFFSPHLLSTTWPGSFLGSFFPQERVFNNFPASFSGSFSFVFGHRTCVINNLLGSFLKKGILFLFFVLEFPTPNH
jgi:hypothetical protein